MTRSASETIADFEQLGVEIPLPLTSRENSEPLDVFVSLRLHRQLVNSAKRSGIGLEQLVISRLEQNRSD